MLKLVIPPSSLHSMNSRMSGWSTFKMPMLAPRRVPPCFTASVAPLNTRRNETGPEARPPVRDGPRNAPAHLLGSLDALPVSPREIPLPQDAQRGLGPLANLGWAGLGQHRRPPFSPAQRPTTRHIGYSLPPLTSHIL